MAQSSEAPRITVEELNEQLQSGQKVAVLDVRRASWEQSDEKIPRAIRVDPARYETDALPSIPEEAEVVVTYCT